MLQFRKRNRMLGYDYSRDNLYFVTCCVKNNECCLGRVVSAAVAAAAAAGTGRDPSVHRSEIDRSEIDRSEIDRCEFDRCEFDRCEFDRSEIDRSEIDRSEIDRSEIDHPEINYKCQLNNYGLIVEERINWLMSQYQYVDIHNYVVMPNHFHLILEIDSAKVKDTETKIKSLSSLIGALKSTASSAIHHLGFERFAWHRSFHDHIIRDDKAYQNISNYIDKNPEKWFQDKFYSKL